MEVEANAAELLVPVLFLDYLRGLHVHLKIKLYTKRDVTAIKFVLVRCLDALFFRTTRDTSIT